MKLTPIGSNQTVLTLQSGDAILFSYRTPVAVRTSAGETYKTEVNHSRTTGKHISQWLGDLYKRTATKPQSYFDQLAEGS